MFDVENIVCMSQNVALRDFCLLLKFRKSLQVTVKNEMRLRNVNQIGQAREVEI